jgi:hypothetical protein
MSIFRRPELAAQMTRQLLHPGVLDEGLRSGLFISGLRRTGKTTFLVNDLIPALEAAGALVIYVDLWTNTQLSPVVLVHAAIRKALTELQTPASAVLKKLERLGSVDVGAFGMKFGFKIENVGEVGGLTIAQALTEVVDQAKTDLVLIIDEVQHAITSDDGKNLMFSIKAARDAINPRPGTPGHLMFIGTGSHRALVSELTARRNQAFEGATSIAYPVLDADYVDHLFDRLISEGSGLLPSRAVAISAFRMLGNRPEELIRALGVLRSKLLPGGSPDDYLPVIAATLRSAVADVELSKLDSLGSLAAAIFERIAMADGDAKGLFSVAAAAEYSQFIGREVRVEEIQMVVNDIMAANLIMRRAHGLYCITDPLVQEIWRERRLPF